MRKYIVVVCVFFASNSPAFSQEKTVLEEHYVLERVRVFYTTEGRSAVSRLDRDSSGTPDHVEDVAKQVWATHKLLCEILAFPDPFKSDRWPNLTCIQVNIRHEDEMGGSNGKAYENSQRARSIPEGVKSDRAIVIVVNSEVDPTIGITPSHETFHLIQYGATYFKNGWFLEGMARWAEHALQPDGLGEVRYSPLGPWPQREDHLSVLFELSYDAEFVCWNPLAKRVDRKGVLPKRTLGKELASLRYSNGKPVIKDLQLVGAPFMRDVLVELGKMDDVAYRDLDYHEWSEDNQKSERNNRYIYQAVMDVLRRQFRRTGRFVARR